MANHLAKHVVTLLRKSPHADGVYEFMSTLPPLIAGGMISNLGSIKNKTQYQTKVNNKRKDIEEAHPAYIPAITSCLEPLIKEDEYSLLATVEKEEKFFTLFRTWATNLLVSGIDIPVFPGYPPKVAGTSAVPDYESDAVADAKTLRMMMSEGKDKGGSFRIPVFPDNFNNATRIQIIPWLAILYGSYDDEVYYKEVDRILGKHKLKIAREEKEDQAIWISEIDNAIAEAEYVKKNKTFSTSYQNYRKNAGEVLTDEDKEIDKIAEELGIPKVNVEIPKEDHNVNKNRETGNNSKDGPDGRGGSKTPGKYDAVFEMLRQKMGKGKGAIIIDDEDEIIAPDLPEKRDLEPGLRSTVAAISEPAHAALMQIPLPRKALIGAVSEIHKNYEFTPTGVKSFMHENGYEESDLPEAVYSIIVVKLISSKAMLTNHQGAPATDVPARPNSHITQGKLDAYAPYAVRMVDTAMFYMCQGSKENMLSWYESFNAVMGRLMTEKKFVQTLDEIVASGILASYVPRYTVTKLKQLNRLFIYRLTRLSSAALIFQAMNMISNDFVYRLIDTEALLSYLRFHKAGIVAQVAAGPLKEYCSGRIDTLANYNLPPDTKIGELAPIENPPYNERLIRQAKIIHDIYGTELHRWYQGEKAMKNFDMKDDYFRTVIKAIKASDAEKIKMIADAIIDTGDFSDFGVNDRIGKVKGIMAELEKCS